MSNEIKIEQGEHDDEFNLTIGDKKYNSTLYSEFMPCWECDVYNDNLCNFEMGGRCGEIGKNAIWKREKENEKN